MRDDLGCLDDMEQHHAHILKEFLIIKLILYFFGHPVDRGDCIGKKDDEKRSKVTVFIPSPIGGDEKIQDGILETVLPVSCIMEKRDERR